MAVVPWQRLGVAAYRAKRGLAHNVYNTTATRGNFRQTYGVQYKGASGKGYNSGLKRKRGFSAARGLRPERKLFDTSVDDAIVSAGMTITNLLVVPQDASENGRIGRKIRIKQILWTASLDLPNKTDSSLATDIVRIMLVQDSQVNGAVFTATQLMDADNYYNFRNLANSGRFRVLMRQEIAMNTSGAWGNGTTNATIRVLKTVTGSKTVDIKVQYDDSVSTGAIGSMRTNNLYWVTQSVLGTVKLEGNVRVRYVDE